MKKTFFSVLVSILTISTVVNAETILLSFSGATTEGRYCLLDSVKIENLTQNWAQMLDCSVDTTFDLPITQIPTGIDNVAASENGSSLLYVHQNFSVGNTVVSINPIHDGIVRMRVIDMMGRVIIEHAEYLTAGTHQYILQLGSPQTYMLSVVTDSESASAKILNMTASGWYELSRITSFPSANLIPSRRIAHANEGDLMRYTGYTNQQGSAVPSEQIIQYQSEPEHIVLQFSPVAKSQAGVYTGMMGFNSQLYTYAFDMLTTSNLTKHKNFVSNLSMASGTILYHAIYTSLDNMIHAPVPEKLENVSIVTFTDGEDLGSRRMSDKFPTNALYLEACNRLIKRTNIDGVKLDAYTIGVKGSDVQDEDAFENNLHQLASDSSNVFYVSNMDEVNTRFRDIAAKIYSTKVSYSLTIKLPAQEPGTLIRFTFDDVTDARNSINYIEGEYEDYSGHQGSLNNVTYSGLKCDNGSTWISSPEGIFDIFTINNFSTCLGEKVSTNNMKQWRYIPSADRWQVNSEFDVSTNTSTTEERTSAIVALVLDCSSSLGSEFTNLKNAAKTFLDILAGKGTITPPSISNASYELGDEQATLHASITNAGSLSITDKGFCVSEYPNMDDAVFYSCGAGTDNFEYLLTNLVDGQTYYIRPYATTLSGKTFGNRSSFIAIAATPPSVNTFDANDITVHSAQLSGEVISANYSNVIERGICWSIAPNPTIDDNKIELGSGLGKFETLINNLDDGTTYYVRAYAINEKGVGYGEEKSFTAVVATLPVLSQTYAWVTDIDKVYCSCSIESDGNDKILESGFCWGLEPNPTVLDNHVVVEPTRPFSSATFSLNDTIKNISPNTQYYVRAYAINSKGISYSEPEANVYITTLTYTATQKLISASYYLDEGMYINASIVSHTFEDGAGLIVFRDKLTQINEYAFYRCSELISIDIPLCVEKIGYRAFEDCSNLLSVTIPESVTSIGKTAFYRSDNLTSVYISNIEAWCKISFEVNANPMRIAHNLFLNNEIVKEVIIPDGIEKIKYEAFVSCDSLRSVVIPSSVKSIEQMAFGSCNNLNSVSIAEGVSYIGNRAFQGCGLITISIPNSVKTIEEEAFRECSNLTTIIMGDSINRIGKYAFSTCGSLESVKISNLKNWCEIDFENFASNPIYYAHNLYLNDELVENLVIPDEIQTIKERTFTCLRSILSVSIHDGVTSIGKSAFDGCHNLASVEVPNSVLSIGEYAFSYCYNLSSFTIPSNITSIETCTFRDCTSLVSIEIPNNIITIAGQAFYSCSNLTSIKIGSGVTSIGNSAFNGCKKVASLRCDAIIPPSCGTSVFKTIKTSTPVYVPSTSVSSYTSASVWSEFTKIQAIVE